MLTRARHPPPDNCGAEVSNCEVLLDGDYYEHVAKAFRMFVGRDDVV
jgi:hypothetical protein